MAGEIADFTDFSFHAVKNFTTAEGGASTWRDIPGIDNDEMYKQGELDITKGKSSELYIVVSGRSIITNNCKS